MGHGTTHEKPGLRELQPAEDRGCCAGTLGEEVCPAGGQLAMPFCLNTPSQHQDLDGGQPGSAERAATAHRSSCIPHTANDIDYIHRILDL